MLFGGICDVRRGFCGVWLWFVLLKVFRKFILDKGRGVYKFRGCLLTQYPNTNLKDEN
jgi:hypothetical protein